MTEWRVFVLGEGDHAACLSVVTDDERQVRLMVADIPPGDTADGVLAEHGWRLDGPWEEGDGSRHAPVRRAGRGRIPRGERCETKLPPDVLGEVEALVGVLGADRSEVIAVLVRVGLEVAAGGHTPGGLAVLPTVGAIAERHDTTATA